MRAFGFKNLSVFSRLLAKVTPLVLVLLGLCWAPRESRAAAELPPPDRVSVLTMGPGEHPFARFGHNALLVEWRTRYPARVYNYGTFSFDGLEGIRDFMAGNFRYWLSVSSFPGTLQAYARQGRSVVAQELDLTKSELAELGRALELNARPENAAYDYDYYYDNCSTRVRDVVDRAVGGIIKNQIRDAGRLTFREHTLRLTADGFWIYFGLDIALGPKTDAPTSRWDETFIPEELQKSLRNIRRPDGRPLVRAERMIVPSDRPPERSEPPARVPLFALFGALFGAAFALLGRAGAKQRAARVGFLSSTALLGLVLGLLGTVFFVFWAFTKHWSAYRNFNLLVFTPWALALVVTQLASLRGKAWAVRWSDRLIAASTGTALLAVLLALIPHFGQDNTRVAALLGPVWLGIYAGSRFLADRAFLPAVLQRRLER